MAKVITTELQHSGASGANVTLDSSKNVTCENNLQVDGNVTVTGTLPADKLTGALPAISGASLTGITTRTQPFRNLVINGACNVAQRGTTKSTHTGHGYFTVDRFYTSIGGEQEGRTEDQITLTASDTGPWEKGFTKAFQITNGDQTQVDSDDYQYIVYKVEGQDIANSGWHAQSASSYLTLSFWVKSSVAQTFYGYVKTQAGTNKYYSFNTGAISANTWTKVTKTIPGHADITINNDTNDGFQLLLYQFGGTAYTASITENAWATWNSSARTNAQTSTWWTTDNATFALTGLQLEVGSTATEFEHKSYGDELLRCQRYFWKHSGNSYYAYITNNDNADRAVTIQHPVQMRANPTITTVQGGDGTLTHYQINVTYWLAYFSGVIAANQSTMTTVQASAEL